MTEPIIEFKDFSFKYNSQAEPTLKNINLKINKGEKILLAGPSGSGKSTIGRCLNGLIPNIDQGEISGECLVNGKDITQTSLFDFSFTTSTILQDADSQFIGLTVGEDIAFALENDCQPKDKMHQTVNQWAEELQIKELLTQSPQSLSGGQKQIVALAGVLVDESPILLFDEPLANLDPASGLKTMAIIDKIQKELNATVIIIEHRVEEVLSQPIDRIVLVNEGQIVADKPTNQLLHDDILEKVGVRQPLYLKAMSAANIDLDSIKKLDKISDLPDSESIGQKLENWVDQTPVKERTKAHQPLLKLDRVGHQYSKNQPYPLKDVSATINQGDFISIVGQNGAGKTTLCRIICGFISNEGKITLKDQDLANLSIKERAEKIGYVMQDPNQMISQKMIFDEIALGLRLRNIDEDTIKQKVNQTLKICGLYPFRHWPISALSFGQKKRVTIASILVLEPEIIILDEPTAGQDWKTYTEIMGFLKHLNNLGKTIIIITHDMHLMLEYTTRSLAFAKGKLIADTSPIDLLTNPELISEASLKRTSLFELAQHYHLPDPNKFVQAYINSEQKNWKDEDYE
ncbi:MAG: ABC transporter ATP-binding protein [Lactobacillus sp.]|uniref:ABC transporter ATP-binding protein n=1 Tax=Lactobacillus sp. TaxID=1591 RepID=UPI0023CE4495|nr:ABC transporter ATP-binding protein [Lactobacillus sp.]MDE7049635.1 ABC transporter ATP-binding protein [Lactobacillus sp.]